MVGCLVGAGRPPRWTTILLLLRAAWAPYWLGPGCIDRWPDRCERWLRFTRPGRPGNRSSHRWTPRAALGHHRDDTVETFFLNLFFGGRLNAMPP
ncbi:MAG: hypothetical protein ACREXW_11360 [Gammaproteobacteria bacterium]